MKLTKNRFRFRDVAFAFRMGAGFAGDVNRTHPAAIEAALQDATNPVNKFGVPVLINASANSVRAIAAGDASATAILPFGFSVRPFPVQASTAGAFGATSFNSGIPQATGAIDILRNGLIMGQLNTGATAVKGGAIYVWCAATTGNHIQGGLESVANAGNTALLDPRYTYNGPADATGVVEISVNV